MEKETALIEQGIQKVKEIESIIEGAIDVSVVSLFLTISNWFLINWF